MFLAKLPLRNSLNQKDEIKINNVIDAFNVENLSKEFFDKKKQFEKFWK